MRCIGFVPIDEHVNTNENKCCESYLERAELQRPKFNCYGNQN